MILVERAMNGFIVTKQHMAEDPAEVEVIEIDNTAIDGEAKAAANLAHILFDWFDLAGDRYSPARPCVVVAPGDKREQPDICPLCHRKGDANC